MRRFVVVIISLAITLVCLVAVPIVTLAADPATSTPTTSVWLTPASRFYGLKVFYEDAVILFKRLTSKENQANYFLHLGDKRNAELKTILEKGIPEPKIVAKVFDRSYDYFIKVKDLLVNAPSHIFWSKQDELREQFYQEQAEFAVWSFKTSLAIRDREANNTTMVQKLHDILAWTEAIEQANNRQAAERAKQLIAERQDADRVADYLLGWAENNKKKAETLAQYDIDPDLVSRAQKSVDDFAAAVQAIKDSGTPDKEQLKQALDTFTNDIKSFDQERWAQVENNTDSTIEPTAPLNVDKATSTTDANLTPTVKTPTPTVKTPAAKPVLKPIPSASVNTEELKLHYYRDFFGYVNSPVDVTFSASGGLPPYHFQLGTGGGFPPHSVVLDANGRISGTPTQEGTYNFNVCVVDTAGVSKCADTTLSVLAAEYNPGVEPEPSPEPEPEPAPVEELIVSVTSTTCNLNPNVYEITVHGTATGPVGSHVGLSSGFRAVCSAWGGNDKGGHFGGCERQVGEPNQTTWTMVDTPDDQGIMELLGSKDNNPCCKLGNPPSCW